MSAVEIIEQIKALPREERAVVMDFVRNYQGADCRRSDQQSTGIRYASDEQAHLAGESVVAEFPETFRRVAE